MGSSSHREIEVKLPVRKVAAIRAKLRAAGFRLISPRTRERNQLYDFSDARLRRAGCAVRVRVAGRAVTLAFKGRRRTVAGMKARKEIETRVADAGAAGLILTALGLRPVSAYEKRRATFRRGRLIATVDETKAGNFLELEGSPADIAVAARELGYTESDYINRTYIELLLGRERGRRK